MNLSQKLINDSLELSPAVCQIINRLMNFFDNFG
jgi:hypothetical protein